MSICVNTTFYDYFYKNSSIQPPPLAGIRVIGYSHFLDCPHMPRCLSAVGAEVIKVERSVGYSASDIDVLEHDGVLYSEEQA